MNAHRVNIIGFLQLAADYAAQRQYQKKVSFVGLPNEMCCQWFDDFYHPEFDQFIQAFSSEELNELALFNTVFEHHIASLPEKIDQLQESNGWRIISGCAKGVMEKFGWENIELKYDSN